MHGQQSALCLDQRTRLWGVWKLAKAGDQVSRHSSMPMYRPEISNLDCSLSLALALAHAFADCTVVAHVLRVVAADTFKRPRPRAFEEEKHFLCFSVKERTRAPVWLASSPQCAGFSHPGFTATMEFDCWSMHYPVACMWATPSMHAAWTCNTAFCRLLLV